jgi:hypothetical protein
MHIWQNGSLGIAVVKGKCEGCFGDGITKTSPHIIAFTEIPKEPAELICLEKDVQ